MQTIPSQPCSSNSRKEGRESTLIIAAGFEVGAHRALELTLVLLQACAAIRAGPLDFFEIRLCDRRGACHPVFLFRSTRRGVRGLLRRLQAVLRTS
jgi:hypothetical protein